MVPVPGKIKHPGPEETINAYGSYQDDVNEIGIIYLRKSNDKENTCVCVADHSTNEYKQSSSR